MQFNEEQQRIIDNIYGAYLISAPVGTGKTTVLTERIIKALEAGIKPEEILSLTFTNRASDEMSERIRKRLSRKEIFDELLIKTFHGFCAYFAKAESKKLGISPDFIILDDTEQADIMSRVVSGYPEAVGADEYGRSREIFGLAEKIYRARLSKVYQQIGWNYPEIKLDKTEESISQDYLQELNGQNALDFNELVITTLQALYFDEELKNKWSDRFKFVQLDEFQDTHISEYLVVKQLARKHKNIAFIGDLDQTIYGWRGSDPQLIADQFKKHFAPVREFELSVNYRFDNCVLEAIKSFLVNLEKRHTKNIVSGSSDKRSHACIDIFRGKNSSEEISWVLKNISDLRATDPNARIAVLSRTNWGIKDAAKIFEERNVAHVTVDKYDFFRRQEIKDLLAYLKILYNRYDLDSAYRLIQRPARNIGAAAIQEIREEGEQAGIKISDFLTFKNFKYSEPFEKVIDTWSKGRLVVLDTETTGTNTLKDEIIQIYAVEVVNGQMKRDFHYYLKNTIPVGNSFDVHGITDEFLEKEGGNPEKVLKELKAFINGDLVVGHNVNFDLGMIKENGKRKGISFEFPEFTDTLDIARRLVRSENYKLNTLAKMFDLDSATHSADDDVRATVGLLGVLVGRLQKHRAKRQEIFKAHAKKFILLAKQIEDWQSLISKKRPREAARQVWEESELAEYYQKEKDSEKRSKNIDTLLELFEQRDNKNRPPQDVLQELLQFSALAKNIDFLGIEKGKIPIVTVHQVKGLEFDIIFIIGANEGKFPVFKPDLEEEKRLFYVALTRARKKILISYSGFDNYGRSLAKSRFLDYIDPQFVKII